MPQLGTVTYSAEPSPNFVSFKFDQTRHYPIAINPPTLPTLPNFSLVRKHIPDITAPEING